MALYGGSARPLDYGRDFQVAELRGGWDGHREDSADPRRQQLAGASPQSGWELERQKLPNRKTVNDKVGDVVCSLE